MQRSQSPPGCVKAFAFALISEKSEARSVFKFISATDSSDRGWTSASCMSEVAIPSMCLLEVIEWQCAVSAVSGGVADSTLTSPVTRVFSIGHPAPLPPMCGHKLSAIALVAMLSMRTAVTKSMSDLGLVRNFFLTATSEDNYSIAVEALATHQMSIDIVKSNGGPECQYPER